MSTSSGQARLLAEWRNRVRAEYGSAGLAAQFRGSHGVGEGCDGAVTKR